MLRSPAWRAGLITVIGFLGIVMLVDTNANALLEVYQEKLLSAITAE